LELLYEREDPSAIIPWSKSRTAVFKISKMSIAPSPRNGTSAETSKTLLILRFLATGVEETNESDFEEAGFSIISSCRLEVSAKGLRPFFPLTYIKVNPLSNKYHHWGIMK
jgi:hypothetical protein